MTTTTIIPFTPGPAAPFQFQATLDGNLYNCVVTWNLMGQRWYLNVYDLSGNLIICTAMAGSPAGYNISLVAPLFDTQLVYRVANLQFEVIG